jgi:hypothetical protein
MGGASGSGGKSGGGSAGQSGSGGAGTAGSAGSGGSGGGPPHVVQACSSAKGGDLPRGVWDNVSPPQVDLKASGTLAFALDPTDTRIIVLGTVKRGIFKSTDCGATWTKIDTGQGTADMDKGNNNHMLIDPTNPKIMYTTSGYGGTQGVLKSTNGGVDWHQTFTQDELAATYGGWVESLSMDPGNPAHLVMIPHGTCSAAYGSAGCAAESTDAGTTWTIKKGSPAWFETQNLQVMDAKTWLIGGWFGDGVWRTSDAGLSWAKQPSRGAAAFYEGSNGTIYTAGTSGGTKSTDRGATWTNMPNSPNASVITGDGTNIYVDIFNAGAYWSAPESNTSMWTHLVTPSMSAGACLPTFIYDRNHKILYSTNCNAGFWRATVP